MSRVHLLLVEDDESIARMFMRPLKRAGHQVTWAFDGLDCLEKLREGRFDLILLDFRMPRLDGLGVLRRLAHLVDVPPVVMLSGVRDLNVILEAMRLGAADYVIKDVEDLKPNLLLGAIDKALEAHALKDALRREKARAGQYLAAAGAVILAIDRDGIVHLVNKQACAVLKANESDVLGKVWLDRFVPKPFQSEMQHHFDRLYSGELDCVEHLEGEVVRNDGSRRIIEWHLNTLEEGGMVCRLMLSGIDITDRKIAEAALAKSEERYELATQAAKVGVWDWDLNTGEMYIDPHLKGALGYSEGEMPNVPEGWVARLHEDDRALVWQAIQQCVDGLQDFCEVEHRMLAADGSERWFITRARAARNADGEVVRLTGTDTDITDLKQAEAHIEHMATHDFLTGLPNRMLLQDRLGVALARARREKSMVAVMFVDLDGFKPINDEYGHDVGDEVLKQVGQRLEGHIRASDTVARFGGDEFILAFSSIGDAGDARRVADKVLSAVCAPMKVSDNRETVVSASIGIALFPRDGDLPEQLIKAADSAMYEAKRRGKRGYAFVPNSEQKELV